MLFPWRELKQTEMMLLKQRCNGGMPPRAVLKLRRLFEQCREMIDADESICYHGALALLHEADGKTEEAMKHRVIEIRKIEYLHELASQNPGDRAALINYDVDDLRIRRDILDELLQDYAKRIE